MYRTLFVFLLLSTCLNTSFAQDFTIEKSPVFPSLSVGWNKLLLLKNGNTFLFHASLDDGMSIMVFDKDHKIAARRSYKTKEFMFSKGSNSTIAGLYEISGKPVMFFIQPVKKVPTLFRVRFDAATGLIAKQDTVVALPKITFGVAISLAYGLSKFSDVLVEKDPNSDCYCCIVNDNSKEEENMEQIRVMHFDGSHKLINDSHFSCKEATGSKFNYIGSVVDGNKRVFLAIYNYNEKVLKGNKDGKVIVSCLNAGQKEFKTKLLDYTEDFKETNSVMLYNKVSNQLQLLTMTYVKSKRHFFNGKEDKYYQCYLSYINGESLDLVSYKPLNYERIVAHGKKVYGDDFDFEGEPLNMQLNADNTTTILLEERTKVTKSTSGDIRTGSRGHVYSTTTLLEDIGVLQLDSKGQEMNGYAIDKLQEIQLGYPDLYIADRSKGIYRFGGNHLFSLSDGNDNEFMSFDYINTGAKQYVLYNDVRENNDPDSKRRKLKMVTDATKTNTMIYPLTDGKVDPIFMFGNTEDYDKSRYCYLESGTYNAETKVYATIRLDRYKKDENATVVWAKFK